LTFRQRVVTQAISQLLARSGLLGRRRQVSF